MEFANPYFIVVLVSVMGFFLLDLVADFLNLSALSGKLPAEFEGVYDAQRYEKSQNYTRETTRFGLFSSTLSLIAFLLFWFLGGFGWLDEWVRGFGKGAIISGLIYFGVVMLAGMILELPFSLYNTFVIEEKYGFNKTDGKTFAMDMFKNVLLSVVIGAPLLALLLWIFETYDQAWLWGWIAVSAFTLIMTYLAPKFILPLFNKFQPMPDGSLKDSIEAMAKKAEFPLCEVSVMDGSKRSTKSNAFFTGFGKNKKIALFDTMVEKNTEPELVAVLAHEIGHYKLGHIIQRMVVSLLQVGVVFYLLSLFMKNEGLFAAFGVEKTSVYLSFAFISFLLKPFSKLLGLFGAIWSRKHEFEADAFAKKHDGTGENLVSALKSLSSDNLSNLTPHPFYVWLNYSHPPTLQRIEALRQ